jgi:hypothetical protein
MTVRAISIEAYERHIESGKRDVQWVRIYNHVSAYGHIFPKTRSELSALLNMRMSSVCGRVHELIEAEMVEDGERRECKITGEPAHTVTLKVSDPRQGGLF